MYSVVIEFVVLNLVINGIPSILNNINVVKTDNSVAVLNLVINGIPSILKGGFYVRFFRCFKPCYKWNTFNTAVKG